MDDGNEKNRIIRPAPTQSPRWMMARRAESVKLHLRRYISEERSGNNGLFEGMEAGQRTRAGRLFLFSG